MIIPINSHHFKIKIKGDFSNLQIKNYWQHKLIIIFEIFLSLISSPCFISSGFLLKEKILIRMLLVGKRKLDRFHEKGVLSNTSRSPFHGQQSIRWWMPLSKGCYILHMLLHHKVSKQWIVLLHVGHLQVSQRQRLIFQRGTPPSYTQTYYTYTTKLLYRNAASFFLDQK